MKPKISPQSKSFLILFLAALVGTYLCLFVARAVNFPGTPAAMQKIQLSNYRTITYVSNHPTQIASPQGSSATPAVVDTSAWKTYSDTAYHFSFNYPPAWKVLKPTTKQGYYILAVDPGAKFYNIQILVSKTGYFAMSGLPYTNDTIDGQPAENVKGLLYGVQNGAEYYTLDEGESLSIQPQFQALVHSLQFH